MIEDNMAGFLPKMSLSLAMMIRKPGGLRCSLHRLTIEQQRVSVRDMIGGDDPDGLVEAIEVVTDGQEQCRQW